EKLAKPLRGEFASGNYFSVFGIRPFLGRLFSPSDDTPSSEPVLVLSHEAWQREWGGNPSVIGTVAVVRGKPFTVIGVAPPGFFGETLRSQPADFWMPLHQEVFMNGKDSLLRQSVSAWLRVIGRLKPGATTDGMAARLTGVLHQWMERESGYPPVFMTEIRRILPKQRIEVISAGNGVEEMRASYERSLQILLAVCGMVLLIACANVANLLLARGMARLSQTSIRIAIGASRERLIAQSLVESVVLATAGGVAGLAVAWAAEILLVRLAFPSASYLPFSTSPSIPVLAFAFGLSLLTGLVFGLAPAWLATQRNPVDALKGAGRSTRDHSALPQKVLLVMQAALSVILVAGAMLLTRSLANLENQDLGFRNDGLVSVMINPPDSSYSPEKLDALYRALQGRLRNVPGVERASLALYAPLTDNWSELIFVDGRPAEVNDNRGASWNRVSAGHFETVGQPVLRGRGITAADTATTENVAVVNEAFVRRFLPDQDPMDKRFGIDFVENARTYRVVGVVRDAKYTQPSQPVRPMFFVALTQTVKYENELLRKLESRTHFIGSMILRSHLSPGELEPVMRKLVAEVDPNITVINVRTMREQISRVFSQERAVASLAALFGAVALLLAAIGLYGVTAYGVAQRTGEIGIRMALGADARRVLWLVLQSAFRLVAFGLVLGLPLAIGAGQLIGAQLHGITAWDPVALAIAIASLAACTLIAALLPASRAASMDPMRALRTE
ncbi:MAG TPA: ABC transporter permease, partial [Bryobacteraceae bacterium]|nr:ABC transporter permease [Bryobacteraceae bacterium]